MKKFSLIAVLFSAALFFTGTVSFSQSRADKDTFSIPVDSSGTYIFSVNTCPGEDCSTQMNVSFAADKDITECYVYLVSSRKKRSAGGYRLLPSDLTLCTVYDSIYSKKANGENFYEDAVFHKFSCSFTNLKPDTRYDYWIVAAYKDDYEVQRYTSSKTYTFTTAGRKEWSACIISDFHSYPPLPKRLESAMNMVETVNSYAMQQDGRGFDWVLHLGDVCAWGGSWSFWKEMYSQDAFRNYMWAGLNGNHDNMSRKYQLTNNYFRYATANPLNGYEGEEGVCYHFTYGNVLFVMLNSESMRDSTGLAKAQEWARGVLKASNAKFKVVCEHYQWFFGENGKTSQLRRWKDLFEEYGVDLALGANNHIYVRSQNLPTVYVQTPSSDNERGVEMKEQEYNQDIIAKRWSEGGRTIGAMLMEVDKNSITLTLLDRNGEVQDSVVIRK
ncbi:MAG: metallophosphoesterase family protein [Bacteroidales bacterium]|nr:metallophosphoesterase family protein [Bacteroidales bacterium]